MIFSGDGKEGKTKKGKKKGPKAIMFLWKTVRP